MGDVFADKYARSAMWPVIAVRKRYTGEEIIVAIIEYICV